MVNYGGQTFSGQGAFDAADGFQVFNAILDIIFQQHQCFFFRDALILKIPANAEGQITSRAMLGFQPQAFVVDQLICYFFNVHADFFCHCIINPGPGRELFGLWVLRAPGLFSLAGGAWILPS
jgi:hypothetical protein